MSVLILFIFLIFLLVVLVCILLIKRNQNDAATADASYSVSDLPTEPSAAPDVQPTTQSPTEPPIDFDDVDFESDTALLCDLEGNELFSQNKHKRVCPASLTKIMTVIVAIENIDDISEKVYIPEEVFYTVNEENGATAGFYAYEEVSCKDLLYGAVLSSGAECCLTLADYISGSEEEFVSLMNSKAEELGMTETSFTNVCGFHDEEHYSTASDISKLLNYALDNDTFYDIFTSRSYYTVTDYHPEGITLYSTMFSEMDYFGISCDVILGGKTGYTDEAGLCLASLADIDGKLYTLVTTGAPGTHYTDPFHIKDAVEIYGKLTD